MKPAGRVSAGNNERHLRAMKSEEGLLHLHPSIDKQRYDFTTNLNGD